MLKVANFATDMSLKTDYNIDPVVFNVNGNISLIIQITNLSKVTDVLNFRSPNIILHRQGPIHTIIIIILISFRPTVIYVNFQ